MDSIEKKIVPADILDVAREASQAILHFYCQPNQEFETKDDEIQSPLTQADLASNQILIKGLSSLYPSIPIVSEENSVEENIAALQSRRVFVIDPLDGTQAFTQHRPEFAISIGLLEDNRPQFGMLYLPTEETAYFTNAEGNRAFFRQSKSDTRELKYEASKAPYTLISTRREEELARIRSYTKDIPIAKQISISSAVKFCRLAENRADLYIRDASICIWDILGGHALVQSLGYNLTDFERKPLDYAASSSNNFRIPPFIVCQPQVFELLNIHSLI